MIGKNTATSAIAQIATQQVVRILVEKVPWLGLGFINPVLSFFVSKILSIAIEQTVLGTAFLWIDAEKQANAAKFENAKQVLSEYLGKKDVPDDDLKRAEEEFDAAFRDAVTLRRS